MLKKIVRYMASQRVECSFCGRGPEPGRRFVSGPSVYICNECVEHAARVLEEDEEVGRPEK